MCFIAALGALGAGSAAAGASASLAMASTAMQGIGMISQIGAQNSAAAANSAAARRAAATSYDQENEALYNNNQSLLQSAMDRALMARSANEQTFVSAFENGAGGSVLGDVLRERFAVEGRNQMRDAEQRTQTIQASQRRMLGHNNSMQNRINAVPTTGFNLGHVMSLGSNYMNLRMGT